LGPFQRGDIAIFKELVPVLRDRAVLLTVTLLEEDQIRVDLVPKKLKDGDNDALTTPLSLTGTAEELDVELSTTIVDFVASHLHLKNTLAKAKAEMDAAAKAAQAEARAKSKTAAPGRKDPPKTDGTTTTPIPKVVESVKAAPPKAPGLFDSSSAIEETTPAVIGLAAPAGYDDEAEEEEILAEIEDGATDEEDLDEAA